VQTSFQFGGALVLAVVTAVNSATTGADGSPEAILDGYQAAVIVSVIAALIGVAVTAARFRSAPEPALEPVPAVEAAADVDVEAEAA
jgi:hypothetical protein